MREAAARVLAGYSSLGESEAHDAMPVDTLHALAAAQLATALAPLGVDLMRLKLSNVARAYKPCLEGLATALMWPEYRLRLRPDGAESISRQLIQETIIDMCPACKGVGERPAPTAVDREGAVPMIPCEECAGVGVRRYTNAERKESVGELLGRMDRAFTVGHQIMSQAVREAMWNARRFRR